MKLRKRLLRRLGYACRLLPSLWLLPSAIKIVEWRAARRCLPLGELGVVLDVGCGAAIQTQLLAERARTVVGIDPAFEHLRFADDLRRLGRGTVQVSLVNGTTAAIASGSCDLVVSFGVLEHTNDPDAVLRDCARVLKPEGLLLLTADAQNGPIDPGLLARFRSAYDVRTLFDSDGLRDRLVAAGFRNVHACYILRSSRSVEVLGRLLNGRPQPWLPHRIWDTWMVERAERTAQAAGGQMVLATARR